MTRPKHTKADGNQAEIVRELRYMGYDVDDVHDLPGIYDIIVCSLGRCVRVEIKSPGEKLNATEIEYHKVQRHPDTLIVAESTEDILKWFGVM